MNKKKEIDEQKNTKSKNGKKIEKKIVEENINQRKKT